MDKEDRICSRCLGGDGVRKFFMADMHLCRQCRQTAPPTVEEARLMYEAVRKYRQYRQAETFPSFDDLYQYFTNDCLSFTNISIPMRRTKERVRKIYGKYFAGIIPRRPDGRTRQKLCTRKRRITDIRIRFNRDFDYLIKVAESNGVTINPVIKTSSRNRPIFGGHDFYLNGRHCCFFSIYPHQVTYSEYRYWLGRIYNFEKRLAGVEFVIFRLNRGRKPGFFIIPTSVMLKRRRVKGSTYRVYVPVEGRSRYRSWDKRAIGAIDYWKYYNSWHILENQKSVPDTKTAISIPTPA